MPDYALRCYQSGSEADQARIGQEVARPWIWPYAYDLADLLLLHAQSDFDRDTCHYAFLGEEMVGYVTARIAPSDPGDAVTATLDFPRVMPGHEPAAGMLMARALETLQAKGVIRVVGRLTTMCPAEIRLAETTGFSIRDWGYKVYYAYKMAWGRLTNPFDAAEEMDLERDLDACTELAARWYARPSSWCRSHLEAWHAAGIVTHTGLRVGDRLVAACMVAPNDLCPSTAAMMYVYTPDARSLVPLLTRAVNCCVDRGVQMLIADLVNEHRSYEPVYQQYGFEKVAEWAHCEKVLGHVAR